MSLAAVVGPQGLVQLGISLADIALIYSQGRRLGNWLMTKRNDEDLFETLMEPPDVLLKRKGIVDPVRMESLFPDTQFIYRGEKVSTAGKKTKIQHAELKPFSWLMVVIVTALDVCLPRSRVIDVLIEVFVHVLDNSEAESSLRVNLDVNVESWRSVGQVRGLATCVRAAYQQAWKDKTGVDAIPELNRAEEQEMIRFLECLLGGDSPGFSCVSATTFAVGRSIQRCGIHIVANGGRSFEGQLLVVYASDGSTLDPVDPVGQWGHDDRDYEDPVRAERSLKSRAQMVSYPAGDPESMVQTVKARRKTINQMKYMWMLGAKAAERISLVAAAEYPYSVEKEVYYSLGDDSDHETENFEPYNAMLAAKAFPVSSQGILSAIETLTEGETSHRKAWLETHVGLEYLVKTQSELPSRREEDMMLWLPYQALVFGFYYKLLEPLVSLEFVTDKSAYYSGLWGHGSTTFLAMCSQFGQELRRNGRVGRTHVLYMLATMYAGRNRMYYPEYSRINLVGILGSVSVLTLPLLRTSDTPQELARFALLDLPIVQLIPNDEGELYAGSGSGIAFTHSEVEPRSIRPHGPSKPWSVHSGMGRAFREGGHGVVMAARCEGRLVGWFSPAAADAMFLSGAYCQKRHADEDGHVDHTCVVGFEVLDKDWQRGFAKRSVEVKSGNSIGVVHSAGCPALRYAAAGFYSGVGEEAAIVTDDIDVALGRVGVADSGIIIA